ncbi:MAG TPA: LysE family translocator [Methylomirabilota bacterium]|nr:LysE family translocator [Methylomirabilota bacterium]
MTLLDPQIIAFAVVAAIVTVIPGADMALVARSVLTRGRGAGYITSVGICTGLWVHAVASALGLSAILMASAALFSAVKLAGALYLVALGVLSLRTAFGSRLNGPAAAPDPTARDARLAFVQGLLSNLLNPKVAIFYLTLLPQFVRAGDPVLARSLLLAGIHVVIGLVWLIIYAYFLGRLGAVLRQPRVRRALEGVTGAVLIGLGARLAWDRR